VSVARDDCFLGVDDDDVLPLQEVLGDDAGYPTRDLIADVDDKGFDCWRSFLVGVFLLAIRVSSLRDHLNVLACWVSLHQFFQG